MSILIDESNLESSWILKTNYHYMAGTNDLFLKELLTEVDPWSSVSTFESVIQLFKTRTQNKSHDNRLRAALLLIRLKQLFSILHSFRRAYGITIYYTNIWEDHYEETVEQVKAPTPSYQRLLVPWTIQKELQAGRKYRLQRYKSKLLTIRKLLRYKVIDSHAAEILDYLGLTSDHREMMYTSSGDLITNGILCNVY